MDVMQERFSEALKAALKSQDKVRISTLRLINAAIKDRDIADRTDNGGEGVSEEVVLEILAKMIKQRQESLTAYEEAGRLDLADQERNEIVVIKEFMPRQLDDDEIVAAVDAALAEVGAETLKDMGKVMGLLKKQYTGQMDFGKAGARVKEKLG
ncbi:MAG TPA: glutamyl-tRNA amidotransferase [Rhodobiaceae bacterium]|nr:glutamyl-tRNA amidotransferase [Rhodobiaceae bacterium]